MEPLRFHIDDILRNPRETLEIEIKQWIDLTTTENKSMIAKEIIALANHGGGAIIIGLKENSSGQFVIDTDAPPDLSLFSPDNIQGIVARYLSPPVQCTVDHQRHPEHDGVCVVIVVPGCDQVPVRAKKGAEGKHALVPARLYVRRPGPSSEEIQTDEEWGRLLHRLLQNRRTELLRAYRALLEGELPVSSVPAPTREDELTAFRDEARTLWAEKVAPLPGNSPARFPLGHYEVMLAYSEVGTVPSLRDLKEAIRDQVRNHSGWPPFVTITRDPIRPYIRDGAVEAWIMPEEDRDEARPDHHDFWRISPDGRFYLRRGLWEDSAAGTLPPGTGFDITTSVRRVAEAIIQARYLAPTFDAENTDLLCKVQFEGLNGRVLVSYGNPNRLLYSDHYRMHQKAYDASTIISVASLPDLLPEVVERLLRPLYDLFDVTLPAALFREEITRHLNHRF